jgi:hypothetical protein
MKMSKQGTKNFEDIIHFVCVMVDITARKRMEVEHEQSQDQFIQAQKLDKMGYRIPRKYLKKAMSCIVFCFWPFRESLMPAKII